ncbi:MAG: LysR substrate-binding domain-containing protein, partial [Rhodoferax sp.]
MTPRLKLHQLRDFVAIAQHCSLRGAARALGLAQPALTRSLRELERELNTTLVERHARGVVLTAVGQRFLLRAQSAVEEVRRAGEEVAQLGGAGQGTVAVALSSAAMIALLPGAALAFRRQYPQGRLRVIEGVYPTIEARLLSGQLDFFVGPRPERFDAALRLELLFHNERVVVGRRGHPLRAAGSLRLLAGADWLLTGLREREEEEYDELFNTYGLAPPKTLMRVESTLGLLSLLSATDALVLLPRQWTRAAMFQAVIEE